MGLQLHQEELLTMPLNDSSNSRTRTDYLEKEYSDVVPTKDEATDRQKKLGHTREDRAEKAVKKEDELIWAWSRDPETDLTQIEARDRAQRHEYGRYNISQSSLSRKLSKLDETMLTGEVIRLKGYQMYTMDGYDSLLDTAPSLLDRHRETLARLLCDRDALDRFGGGGERTPEWAQDRFPELDPNIGRERVKAMAEGTTDTAEAICGGLHEPHE